MQTNYISVAAFDSSNALACFQDASDINKGKCVHIGRVVATDGQPLTVSATVGFETGRFGYGAAYVSVATFDSTNAIVCYQDKTTYSFDQLEWVAAGSATSNIAQCAHVGLSGTTLTVQTAVQITTPKHDLGFPAGEFNWYAVTDVVVATFDSLTAVMCYIDTSDSNKGKCTVIVRSGTTLTTMNTVTADYATTAPAFESDTTAVPSVAIFDSTKGIVCWADGGSSPTTYKGMCSSITLSGTSISYGTAIELKADDNGYKFAYPYDGDDGYLSVTTSDSTTALVCYQDMRQGNFGDCVTVTLSGTALTAGSSVIFEWPGPAAYISATSYGTSHSIVCYQDNGDSNRGKCSYVFSGSASVYGDPHLRLAHGGRTDFRGTNGKVYNILSAPNISFSVETSNSHFYQDYGKQLVHGSHFRKAYFVLRTPTGQTIKVASYAHDCPYHVFKSYEPFKVFTQASGDSLRAANADIFWSERGRVTVRASGWEVNVTCRTLYKPVSGTSRMTQDVTIRTLDDNEFLSAKYGKANVHLVAPHGIIGQSFTPGLQLKDGKLDNYTDAAEVTTTAQAEGAIEGVYTDYEVKAWSPVYKYSRFDAKPNATAASSYVQSAGSLYAATEDLHRSVEAAAA